MDVYLIKKRVQLVNLTTLYKVHFDEVLWFRRVRKCNRDVECLLVIMLSKYIIPKLKTRKCFLRLCLNNILLWYKPKYISTKISQQHFLCVKRIFNSSCTSEDCVSIKLEVMFLWVENILTNIMLVYFCIEHSLATCSNIHSSNKTF